MYKLGFFADVCLVTALLTFFRGFLTLCAEYPGHLENHFYIVPDLADASQRCFYGLNRVNCQPACKNNRYKNDNCSYSWRSSYENTASQITPSLRDLDDNIYESCKRAANLLTA